jgi:hypothetical protein
VGGRLGGAKGRELGKLPCGRISQKPAPGRLGPPNRQEPGTSRPSQAPLCGRVPQKRRHFRVSRLPSIPVKLGTPSIRRCAVSRSFLRAKSERDTPGKAAPAHTGATGETACPTTRHQQRTSLVGQAFSLSLEFLHFGGHWAGCGAGLRPAQSRPSACSGQAFSLSGLLPRAVSFGLSRNSPSNRFLRSRLSRASGEAGLNSERPLWRQWWGRSVTCHFRAFTRGGSQSRNRCRAVTKGIGRPRQKVGPGSYGAARRRRPLIK